MNQQLEDRLKQEFTRRRSSIRFGERLGEGAFSVTFAAWDGHVPCAVKFSRDPWTHDPGVAKERENLLKMMLDCNGHPHIASLFYVDDDVHGHLATVWERGEMSLKARLDQCLTQRRGALPLEELLHYMEQAAEGLDFLHAKGIVHRDIKPDNLLLVQGQVKLIDFGFARLAEMQSAVNSVRGTPVFAPPEASDDRLLLEPQYDIYCLAGTFIRLATGQFPFGTGDDLRQKKSRGTFHSEGLARHQVEALSLALAANPRSRRFPTATALVQSLKIAPPPIGAGIPNVATSRRKPHFFGSGKPQVAEETPAVPPQTNQAKPASPANKRRSSFLDRIQEMAEHEQQELKRAASAAEEARERRLIEFHRLLDKQMDAAQLPLAYGTVLALLRDDAKNPEYLEVRKFLEQPDARTGRPRCCDEVGIRYALIPAGEFIMGSQETPDDLLKAFPQAERSHFEDEWPPHRVRITQSFYMSLHPTTLGQFRQFAYSAGYKTEGERDGKGGWGLTAETKWEQRPEFTWRNPGYEQDDEHPVVLVSWNDVQEFIKWHRERTKLLSNLPTEAQWEYGCRAGTTTRHFAGNDPEQLVKIANASDASAKKTWGARHTIQANDGYAFTSPVGKFAPNTFGLFDMIGNVFEWCQDHYDAGYYAKSPTDDPQGPDSGGNHVVRGGSFATHPWFCRSGCRYSSDASHRNSNVGFRLLFRLS